MTFSIQSMHEIRTFARLEAGQFLTAVYLTQGMQGDAWTESLEHAAYSGQGVACTGCSKGCITSLHW